MPSLNHCDLLRHVGVNNLPKVITRQRRGRELNSQPASCKFNALATRLPSHYVYDLRKNVFVDHTTCTVNEFKTQLDKLWQHKAVKFDFYSRSDWYWKLVKRSYKVIMFIDDRS